MLRKLCIVFHALTLCHHIFAGKYTTDYVDYSKTDDPEVLKIKQYEFRFFTTWNLVFQIAYFALALLHDLIQNSGRRRFEELRGLLQTAKGYIFTALVFPSTLFVFFMFWGIFTINREWVLPRAADLVIPSWLNHSMHTNILVALIIETLLVEQQRMPRFKSALVGLSVCMALYDVIFFLTYFQSGRWLYGLFYIFTWTERVAFMVFNYLLIVLTMGAGIGLQNMKSRSRTLDYLIGGKLKRL